MFYGVSVLTFDSKSRRAISGPDRTPGCGWEEWQGLVAVPCKRGGGEKMIDGEVATESGDIHRGAEKASSSGAGVLGRRRHVTLRGCVGSGLGPELRFFVAKAVGVIGKGRQGRQKLAPLQTISA